VAQGAGSLARIIGPIFATTTLHYMPALPYLTCTVVLFVTAAVFAGKMKTPEPTLNTSQSTPLPK
jgi:hypothetical protein